MNWHHWFLHNAKARDDISSSPAFNGKASALDNLETMDASSTMATSVSAWKPMVWSRWRCDMAMGHKEHEEKHRLFTCLDQNPRLHFCKKIVIDQQNGHGMSSTCAWNQKLCEREKISTNQDKSIGFEVLKFVSPTNQTNKRGSKIFKDTYCHRSALPVPP